MFACLVTGSRCFDDVVLLFDKLDHFLQRQEEVLIVHGGAIGADSIAAQYAEYRGLETKVFLPDWEGLGKKAGFVRNKEMIDFISKYPDKGCVVFWDGESKGTAHTIKLAKEYGIPLRVIKFNKD